MLSSFMGGTSPPPAEEEKEQDADGAAVNATTKGVEQMLADGSATEQTVESLKDSIQQLLDLCAE